MTLVVGVNLGEYGLLAADDRHTLYQLDSEEVAVESGFEKVRSTPVGLATGSGYTDAIFGAIDDLCSHPDEMKKPEVIASYLRDFMSGFGPARAAVHRDPRTASMLTLAGWIFTSVERHRVRVRGYHPDWNNFGPAEPDRRVPLVLLPLDMTAEMSRPLEWQLRADFVDCRAPGDIAASLERNIGAVARFFTACRARSQHLGDGIQLGLHFRDGECEILPVTSLESLL